MEFKTHSWWHVQRFFKIAHKWKPGTVVVITGASSGIGEQLAYLYCQRPCRLALIARNVERLDQVAKQCQQISHSTTKVMIISLDVTKESQCKAGIATVLSTWGQLDLLVLNAGIGAHHIFSQNQDMDLYKRLMDTNFYGYVHFVKHAFDELCRKHGQVVVVNSISGEMGFGYRSAYCASKFAVTGFFEALRAELREESPTIGQLYKFDITIICPPTVSDTNLRQNAAASMELDSTTESSSNVTAAETASFIVEAYLGVYVRPFLPDFIDGLARKVSGVMKPNSSL